MCRLCFVCCYNFRINVCSYLFALADLNISVNETQHVFISFSRTYTLILRIPTCSNKINKFVTLRPTKKQFGALTLLSCFVCRKE